MSLEKPFLSRLFCYLKFELGPGHRVSWNIGGITWLTKVSWGKNIKRNPGTWTTFCFLFNFENSIVAWPYDSHLQLWAWLGQRRNPFGSQSQWRKCWEVWQIIYGSLQASNVLPDNRVGIEVQERANDAVVVVIQHWYRQGSSRHS